MDHVGEAAVNGEEGIPARPEIETGSGMRRRRGFYMFREPLVYWPLLIAAAVALFAPADVMDRLHWLKPITAWLRMAFFPMDAYIAKSAFPQVTEIYFLLMLVHAPTHIYFVRSTFEDTAHVRLKQARQGQGWRDWVVILIFMPLGIFYGIHLDPGRALAITPIHQYRWALAAFGWIYAGGAVCILIGSMYWAMRERLVPPVP